MHISWSSRERDRLELEREREEFGDVACWRSTRVHSVTSEGVPLYVEVDEPGMSPDLDAIDGEPF
jgi:hypothetical protein